MKGPGVNLASLDTPLTESFSYADAQLVVQLSGGFMRSFNNISTERHGRILTLTLNRPEVANAVNAELHSELADLFTEADRDPLSDVVILTGAGTCFSAGGDIEHMWRMHSERSFYENVLKEAKQIIYSLLDMQKPIIAKLNGHTTGFGATLALFCDIVFGSEQAKIGDPHVCVGLSAGDGAAVIWPQLIGFARAKEYLMTGRLMSMAQAAQIGLINYAVPADELDGKVNAFAASLANGPRLAISATKMTINIALRQLASTMMDASLAYEVHTAHSNDHREGLCAFRDKRPANYIGS